MHPGTPPDISQWSQSFDVSAKPWVIIGKGPSFDRHGEIARSEHFICSLNHVVREFPVTVAHFIDIEPLVDCQEDVERHAQFVIMPFHPHVGCKPGVKTIIDHIREIPCLTRLNEAGRVVWYNLDSSKPNERSSIIISARHFSSACALDVLSQCGASRVFSLGVDGGAAYSSHFSDLSDTTLLANGHNNFDAQFKDIARVLFDSKVCFSPWGVEAPVRVFVGSDEAQMTGVKVLEYSIKKHSSISVEVQTIDNRDIPVPQDPANHSRTGFSFARFDIPRLCGYKGRGIYMDADMLVFRDIRELWTLEMGSAVVGYANHSSPTGRIPQYSVLLLDCGRLHWDVRELVAGLDERRYDYKGLMHEFCIATGDQKQPIVPEGWNSLESYDPKTTRLIHYTDMNTQPWVTAANKHGELWYNTLREAVKVGAISTEFINQQIEAGHVSPEILVWAGLPDPNNFAKRRLAWVPPYTRFMRGGPLMDRIKGKLKRSPVLRRLVHQSRFVASLRRVIGA